MSKLFKRGYEAARDEKKRQDEIRESMGKRLFNFFLTEEDDEADIRFLTSEPITFNEHTIKRKKNGKEFYDTVLCTDKKCEYCEEGDRPSFKGAFLVWDYRSFETKDSNGKTRKVSGSLKLYKAGTRIISQLDRLSSRYGLTDKKFTVSRTGSGTSTQYMFERGEELDELTEDEITAMLPEKLQEMYDGTEQSLYDIIEEQLLMSIKEDSVNSSDDEDEDEDDEDNSALVDYDDEDEEEDEAPRKSSSKAVKTSSLKSKSKSNKVRGMFRK